ncbi:MAG: polysaccharide biosynthesis protein [Alistipes sp.]|nr:polysaccharide biosynthesis protein [Alistipes sp.]
MRLLKYPYLLSKRHFAPRWIVFVIDVLLSTFALTSAVLICKSIGAYSINWHILAGFSFIIIGVRLISFILFRTYSGIIRYTSTHDILRIFYCLTTGEIVLLGIDAVLYFVSPGLFTPFPFLLLEYTVLFTLMIASRLVFKTVFAKNFVNIRERKNVVIYGSEQYLVMLKHVLSNTPDIQFHITAFIDSSNRSAGKILSGVKIYRYKQLPDIFIKDDIDMLIIAQKLINVSRKQELLELCSEYKVEIKEVPNLDKLVSGDFSINSIKAIKIEDLLERGVIEIDDDNVRKQLNNKCIMVTGAAGSIGSEIVRQLTRFNPSRIVLLDIAESPLYDIELELLENLKFKKFAIELASIRDKEVLENIFRRYRPDIVYHAAAYKHVPMIENLPIEGVKTNILGTRNVADLAVAYGCEKFVMVSTDKAVNPTNVMGCTKRMAEIYIQSLNKEVKTAFVTTRFGNVLGSNGSVIPRFAKQIEEGGPLTVTHPDITRFFMTIPEACQLVLQAGALGEGGEIFVFDMGESVKIVDLAKNMIRLSGYEVGKEIKIVYTGLRPGEKLYEEVLNKEEEILPTLYKRINRAKVREYDFAEIKKIYDYLGTTLPYQNDFNVIRIMKIVVPEFKSNNSVYEKVDEILKEKKEGSLLNRILDSPEMEKALAQGLELDKNPIIN